jgi:NAD(P)-dependent dehydrogenase (short-subunit alcohol dehydrogenase family)
MSSFSASSTAEEVTADIDLTGKTIAITGCNSGLGKESARVLALRGAHIVGLARTKEKALAAFSDLGLDPDKTTAIACELSEPSSVRGAAKALLSLGNKLDVLLCNAGIMALPERIVRHGLELQFLTNHMGHFILVTEAMDALAPKARVVVLSSGAHRMAPAVGIDFDDLNGAKKRFDADVGTSRTASSLHPGVIKTNLGRYDQDSVDAIFRSMEPGAIKSIPQGAATQVLLCARPEGAKAQGRYFADCQLAATSKPGKDDALAERLWSKSEELAASL